MTCSRAYLQGVSPCTQSLPTQVGMRREAAWFAALAAELAANLARYDTLRAATQCVWNACGGGCDFAPLRAAFVDPLTLVCAAAQRCRRNKSAAIDPWLDARVNALLCACMLSAGRAEAAITHARVWQTPPAHAAHSEVWAWLFEIARAPQVSATAVAEKLGMYSRAFQAQQWLAVARVATGHAAQRKALDRACKAAAVEPILAADTHLVYVEWLLTAENAKSTEEEVAARIASAFMELTGKDPSGGVVPTEGFTLGEGATNWPQAASARSCRTDALSGRSECGDGVVSCLQLVQQILEDGQLEGAACLEAAMRACTLASLAVEDSAGRLAWLMCAHTCAAQMAAFAFHLVSLRKTVALGAAAAHAAVGLDDTGEEGGDQPVVSGLQEDGEESLPTQSHAPAFPAAPCSLWGWLELSLTQEQLATVLQGGDCPAHDARFARLDVARGTVPWPERTLAWLGCLAQQLEACGCTAHRVPVHWLQVIVAARLVGGVSERCFLAQLSAALDMLGFAHQGRRYSQYAGVLSLQPGLCPRRVYMLSRGFVLCTGCQRTVGLCDHCATGPQLPVPTVPTRMNGI